jgi:hypothetical protein
MPHGNAKSGSVHLGHLGFKVARHSTYNRQVSQAHAPAAIIVDISSQVAEGFRQLSILDNTAHIIGS